MLRILFVAALTYEIWVLMPTAGVPWELEASAPAMSARVKITPPCTVPWLFLCRSCIFIRTVALPAETSTSSMPVSCAHASFAKNWSGGDMGGVTMVSWGGAKKKVAGCFDTSISGM